MTVGDLYSLAEQDDICVYAFDLGERPALSVQHDDGACDIALNMDFVTCEAVEKAILAHELGHCEEKAFYNRYSHFDLKQRHENRANRWAFRHVIPYEDMLSAMRSGYTSTWALAEHFDLPEDFVQQAYIYYTGPCGLTIE